MPQLLTNSSATGASTPVTWGGGNGEFEVSGSFNGATIALQSKNADGTFSDVSGTAMTASGKVTFSLSPSTIRANVTVATPTSVSAAAWRRRGSTQGGTGTGTGAVSSVAGRIGDVTLAAADLTDDPRIEAALASIPQTALAVHAVPISGGSWDPAGNVPTITSGTAPTDGIVCRTCSGDGTTLVDGQSVWKTNDTITWNGTIWYRTATFPRASGTSALVTSSSTGQPGTLAGGAAAGPLMLDTSGVPSIGTVGRDVGAPIFAVSNQPWGIAPSGATIGANGGALTLTTALIETYGPTGGIPYDGVWLWFEAAATDTGSLAGFYWCVMTSTTAGTVYNNYLAAGNAGLNKPPTTPTLYTTNAGKVGTTGTTSQILGWIPGSIPAGYLGANGFVEIEMSMRSNSSAGSKQLQPKFGGSNTGAAAPSSTTSTVIDQTNRIFNKNNAARQGSTVKCGTGTISLTLTPAGGTANTANATAIGLDLKLATATDWVICQFAAIKAWPAA